jgi:hypothetical protein
VVTTTGRGFVKRSLDCGAALPMLTKSNNNVINSTIFVLPYFIGFSGEIFRKKFIGW